MGSLKLFRSAAAAGLLLLALSACGSDDEASTAAPSAAAGAPTDMIEVKDFAFNPEMATVKAGTPVTWVFKDSADHNVAPVGESELEKSPDLSDGKTFTFTFTKPGTVEYQCGIHNSMTGTVVVTA